MWLEFRGDSDIRHGHCGAHIGCVDIRRSYWCIPRVMVRWVDSGVVEDTSMMMKEGKLLQIEQGEW